MSEFIVDDEFRVESEPRGQQYGPTIAPLKGGGFVVVWSTGPFVDISYTSLGYGDGSGYGLQAQIFDAAGLPDGDPFFINSSTEGSQDRPVVTPLADGGFAVGWVEWFTLTLEENPALMVRVFEADGTARSGEVQAHLTPDVNYAGWVNEIPILGLADGGFLVAWTEYLGEGNGWDIKGQLYSSAASQQGQPFDILSESPSGQPPQLAALADGGFAATWVDLEDTGNRSPAVVRIFDQSVAPVSEVLHANTPIPAPSAPDFMLSYTWDPHVAGLKDGSFVVIWSRDNRSLRNAPDNPLGLASDDDFSVHGQLFSADGTRIGGQFQVNTSSTGGQTATDVVALENGGFAVGWSSYTLETIADGRDYDLFMQLYDESAERIDGEIAVNTLTAERQNDLVLAGLEDGGVVAAWSGEPDGQFTYDYRDVKARIFAPTPEGLLAPRDVCTDSGTFPDSGQEVTLTLSLPEDSAGDTATALGGLSAGVLPGGDANIAIILDVSGSTGGTFSGASAVGDLNGDGAGNTILDAEIAGLQRLVEALQANDVGNTTVSLISFSTDATLTYSGAVSADGNGNGVLDILEAASTLRADGLTDFGLALQEAIDWFGSDAVTADVPNQVFFLSDGVPSGGDYLQQSATLRDPGGIKAEIRAFGVGAGASAADLDLLDDGLSNGSAEVVDDPSTLGEVLTSSGLDPAKVQALQIFVNGTLQASLTGADLQPTRFGLSFAEAIGLQPGAEDTVLVRALLDEDGDGIVDLTLECTGAIAEPPPPTIADDDSAQTAFGTPVSIDVLAGDSGSAPLEIVQVGVATDGTVTLDDRGTMATDDDLLVYTPDTGFSGSDSFTYRISDGRALAEAMVTVIVAEQTTRPPVAQDDILTIPEGATASGNLLADNGTGSDSDPNTGAVLSVTRIEDAQIGTGATLDLASGARLTVGAYGAFSYDTNGAFDDLASGETVLDRINYTLSDETGLTDTGELRVTITGSGTPEATPDPYPRDGAPRFLTDGATPPQTSADMALLNDGSFVVTWLVQQDWDVMARRFDAGGAPLGAEYNVGAGDPRLDDPAITALDGGGHVVAWSSSDPTEGGSGSTIRAQVFGTDGAALGDEIVVSADRGGFQVLPEVTALQDGGFLASWSVVASTQDGSGDGIFAQRHDATGAPVGAVYKLNDPASGAQADPVFARLADGRIVATWYSEDFAKDGDGLAIMGRILARDGSPDGPEFVVNASGTGDQYSQQVVGLADGGFVAAWTDTNPGTDGSESAVLARLFDADGSARGADFLINGSTFDGQHTPILTALDDGGFAVAWTTDDPGAESIFGEGRLRFFDANGTPRTAEDKFHAEQIGTQAPESMITNADGGLALVWASNDYDTGGDSFKFKLQLFERGAQGLLADPDSAVTPADTAVAIDVLDNDSGPDALRITGVTQGAVGRVAIDDRGTQDTADDLLVYTPDPGTDGVDEFTYTIASGTENARATVRVSVDQSLPFPVVADDDTAITAFQSAVLIDVLDGDTGFGDLEITGVGTAANGTVEIFDAGTADTTDDLLRYTPDTGFSGTDSFTYTVGDGTSSDTATVTVGVAPEVPLPPEARDDIFYTEENAALTGQVFDDNAFGADSDPNTGDTFRVVSVEGNIAAIGSNIGLISGARLEMQADGTFTYDPNGAFDALPAGATEVDGFQYTIADSTNRVSTALVTVVIDGLDPEGQGDPAYILSRGDGGDNILNGTALADQLEGLGGNDELNGFGGNDLLLGGEGSDILDGGAGDDIMNAGDNADFDAFIASAGNDTILFDSGVSGYFTLYYREWSEAITAVLDGVSDTGSVRKAAGQFDTLAGISQPLMAGLGQGGVGLAGTAFDDSFDITLDGGTEWMQLYAGPGNDTIILRGDSHVRLDYQSAAGPISVDLTQGRILDGEGGTDTVIGHAWEVRGTDGDDVYLGSHRDESFIGRRGNDRVDGGGGTDRMRYDRAGENHVSVDLAKGTATVSFGPDETYTHSLVGIETVHGTRGGNDDLRGSNAAESLFGLHGDDTLSGGRGRNLLDGGHGIDTADYSDAVAGVNANLRRDLTKGTGLRDDLVDIENLVGSAFRDVLVGKEATTSLSGGAGNDVLRASDRSAARLIGGEGDDKILGRDGAEVIFGGAGNDLVRSGAGNDTVHGGDGADILRTGRGDDSAFGEAGDDRLFGNRERDVLHGGEGDDRLDGGGAADVLQGGAGNDALRGGSGVDTLVGGAGDDNLYGGDNPLADGNRDTFVFQTVANGFDRIKDFEDGKDWLDLSAFGFADFEAVLEIASVIGTTNVKLDFGSDNGVVIENFSLAHFDVSDVILA